METLREPSLANIKQKLKEHISGESVINERARIIAQLVDQFSPQFERSPANNIASPMIQRTLCDYREKHAVSREYAENMTAAYLFAMNRKFIGEHFDQEKEARQIKAVMAFLNGNHVHLGTGEGKSSVVFPIASIVEAFCSDKQESILSTANNTLLAELQTNTKRFLDELDKNNVFPQNPGDETPGPLILNAPKDPEKTAYKDLNNLMLKEALLKGEYSKNTREKIRETYWTDALAPVKKRADFLDEKHAKSRITFLTERNLVFAYAEDPQKFIDNAPVIFMDEAHVPYDRNSPYEQTGDSLYFHPTEVENSSVLWMIDFLTAKVLKDENGEFKKRDFILDKGRWQLKEHANARLVSKIRRTITHLADDSPILREAVSIMTHNLNISEEEQITVARRIKDQLQETLQRNTRPGNLSDEEEGPYGNIDQLIITSGNTIAKLHNELGSSYVFDENEDLEVRDAYLGKVVMGHQFHPEIQLAIQAMHDKFKFISQEKKASRVVHYQTFIGAMGDKIRCASGSLLFPDPQSKKIVESPFAYFLEQAVKKDVVLITPPELKNLPLPKYFQTDEEAIKKLVDDNKEKFALKQKPTLIVSWKEGEAKAIYEAMTKTFGKGRIRFVSSNPTPEEEKAIYRDLAEGKVDFVISSGGSGLGVDIKKMNGEFPDLRVELFNLPHSRLQLLQALARRRMEGDDFSWYISTNSLVQLVSHYENQVSPIKKFLGAVDGKTIRKRFTDAENDPAARLKIIMMLLEKGEKESQNNDVFTVLLDQFMEKTVMPQADAYLNDFVEKTYEPIFDYLFRHKQKPREVKEEEIAGLKKWLNAEYGLPADIYDHLLTMCSEIMNAENIHDLVNTKLYHYIKSNPIDIGAWVNARMRSVDELYSIIWDNGNLDHVQRVQFYALTPNNQGVFDLADVPTVPGSIVGLASIFATDPHDTTKPVLATVMQNQLGQLLMPKSVDDHLISFAATGAFGLHFDLKPLGGEGSEYLISYKNS